MRDHLPRLPIVQLAGTASRPPSERRYAMATPASDLRKFVMIKATTCGNAIEAFAETC
jgi:hypothetical protein